MTREAHHIEKYDVPLLFLFLSYTWAEPVAQSNTDLPLCSGWSPSLACLLAL